MEYDDFLQFLIGISKEKHLSCTDITAYGVMFLFDGYETASMVLTYVLLNLAQKPQYQEKIRDELRRVGGEISLETMSELHWTEACIYGKFSRNARCSKKVECSFIFGIFICFDGKFKYYIDKSCMHFKISASEKILERKAAF